MNRSLVITRCRVSADVDIRVKCTDSSRFQDQSRAHHSWSKSADGKAEESEEERLSVVDQYISLLLAIFIDCGIIEVKLILLQCTPWS